MKTGSIASSPVSLITHKTGWTDALPENGSVTNLKGFHYSPHHHGAVYSGGREDVKSYFHSP